MDNTVNPSARSGQATDARAEVGAGYNVVIADRRYFMDLWDYMDCLENCLPVELVLAE